MVFHMKTTLVIPDPLMARLRREAARQQTTISALVERAVRMLLEHDPTPQDLVPLPRFKGGRPLVDVANRDALYERMDEK